MKIEDHELQRLIYSVLRRCPHDEDQHTASKIVDAIILHDLKHPIGFTGSGYVSQSTT